MHLYTLSPNFVCCLSSLMESCRYGISSWRPFRPYVHACSRTRARRWAETWLFLAEMKDRQNVDVPLPDVVEEILEVVEITPRERISKRLPEQAVDVPVPTNESHDVVHITPHERISERMQEHKSWKRSLCPFPYFRRELLK